MAPPLQLIRKLHALTNRLDEALETRAKPSGRTSAREYFDPMDAIPWFERWNGIRGELIASDEELADIPQRPIPKPSETSDNDGRGYVRRDPIERMRNDIADVWDVLNHPSRQLPQVSIDREGIFVAGQPFDAMLAITSILRAASKSITVIDAYVSDHTLSLLGVKADAVVAKVLTKTQSANATFITAARAFIAQYAAGPTLEVRTTNAFHDRFIVVDDVDYYHFGASLKDAARRSAFMFSRLEEATVIKSLATTIAQEWSAGTVVQL